ncbi:COQ9 family protein [Actibacterium sp. 188UL27-1]|uniref:COQ9 family protein n=1 Tax=Actibacterium sp. 188UL27-1 TaxID=2786961 RepID=UPI00195A4855|nr:COQ9 family protein [Actibacterium sp. 188UL27-1]MBM7067916.1 COQ9 family protein [Actibacterium sp. 188UL27-1]
MSDTANRSIDDIRAALLAAAEAHVPFDGWSETSFRAAMADTEIDPALARTACPRGAIDLALAFHAKGDAQMIQQLQDEDLTDLRFRDRIARAVRLRLEAVDDKELVRRGTTLFSLPQYAGDGAKALWGTADAIWTALDDQSDDINWYTKRGTLSGVYGATVLYWLGDDSSAHQCTWDFLDRRIDNVMQFEKLKAQVNDNPVLKRMFAGPLWMASQVKAPSKKGQSDMPGTWQEDAPVNP